MRLTLNSDRCPVLFVPGVFNFTFETPGPVTIEKEKLSPIQLQQLANHVRLGNLVSDEKITVPSQVITIAKPTLPAPQPGKYDQLNLSKPGKFEDPREKTFRALLRQKVPVIKKSLKDMKISDLRLLLEVEEETKNRQALKDIIQERLTKVLKEVQETVGIDPPVFAMNSTNVPEVVESDGEELTISIPGD